MKEGRAAARWIMPLTASFVLHVVFFCLFGMVSAAAPGAPPAVTRGVTVVLRRVGGASSSSATAPAAAAPAEKAADWEKVVPKTAAVPKKDAPAAKAKAARKAKASSGEKAERAPAAPVQPAAKAMTDTASAASEGAASEGAASEGAAPVNSAVQGGVPGEDSGTKGLSNLKGVSNSQPADAGRIVELSDLRVSRRVKPDYPAIARKRREEGTVTLLITLEGANVLSVKVEKSSGFSALDEAAAAAVRRWRFEPDSRARSRRIQARVPVTFRLKP